MRQNRPEYDVMVMGMGYAGLAAALFAARQGLSVALCGAGGGMDSSSGLIDLLGVHPVTDGKVWEDPWAAMDALVKDNPKHPYAHVFPDQAHRALEEVRRFLRDQDLPYMGHEGRNCKIITAMGGLKRSYMVPATVWPAVEAWEHKAPCLLVDFHGFKGYSACQIRDGLSSFWPDLKVLRMEFPGKSGELYPQHLAQALVESNTRKILASTLKDHLPGIEFIGFPAVLGLKRPFEVITHLEELTQKRIFEVPTLPPSIAGLRLHTAFERGLAPLGVQVFSQQRVFEAQSNGQSGWVLGLGYGKAQQKVHSRGVILAAGRFLAQGLCADRQGIREPVFGLPVDQPGTREHWCNSTFFHPEGHPRSRAGLLCDDQMRPLDASGNPMHDNLHAAGAILAGHDWAREKSGAGLAIVTAYQAVQCLAKGLNGGGA